MISLKLCRTFLIRFIVVLVIISSFLNLPAYSQESEDSQIFISGFNAYQQKDYSVTIKKMNEVLQKFPDTPLRDMVLFWLSRAYYKNGNLQDAAKFMSQFSKEYPDNPLKGTVDDQLLALTARYEKGENLSNGIQPAAVSDNPSAVQKTDSEKARLAKEKIENERLAKEQLEQGRIAVAKAEEAQAAKERIAKEQVERERLAAAKAEEARIAAAAETARLKAIKIAEERKQTEAAEQLRLAAIKKDEERRAAELRAEEAQVAKEKIAKEQAEQERLAAAKAEEARIAAVAETARLEAIKIAEDRKQAEVAEQLRLTAAQKDKERKAAEEQLRVEREKTELVRLAELRKEQERLAAEKAEEERKSQEKAALAKRAIEVAEQQKLAAIKLKEERKASEKLQAEHVQREKAEHEKLVSQQDELMRLALEKAEKKRIAAEKIESERNAGEAAARAIKAEKRRLAALKAEQEQAAATIEAARLDALKKDEEHKLAEKAEQQRIVREKAELERKASAAAEATRLAAIQKEQEIKAAAKAEEERLAQEQAALAKRAAAEAERQKLALLKQEQERIAAERAENERLATAAAEAAQRSAAKQEQVRREAEKPAATTVATASTPAKTVEQQLPQHRENDEKNNAAKAALRDKAIAQYKSILLAYPNTKAAFAAAGKLKDLGVAVALPTQTVAAEPTAETAQVLRLEVAQFAGLEFNLLAQPQAYNVAQKISLPFEITNQGNGSDSFYLESGFPADFSAGFTSAAMPAQAINQTSLLAPGESFKGFINLTIPATSIDGLRISHPIKASSRTMAEATQSREVRVIAAAPLLRATVKVDRNNPLPGEKITYRVAVLNVGSTGAQDVSFRLNFPPQLEPVDYVASGFRQEMKAALVIDGLQLKSGENKEFSLSFQLKEGSLAGQELLTRAELQNNLQKTNSVFVSTAAYVQAQHGMRVQPGSERLVVIPGQKISVPFVITNTGNVREKFNVISGGKTGQAINIFHDLNRDGIRQANEPVISDIGPLAAKEEASIVMEIVTPRTATDGSEDSVQISFISSGDAARSFAGVTKLFYSRPVLQMAMSGRDGRLKPGEVASFDLTITNHGSNLARIVELQSAWPEQLELVAADPANNSVSNGTILWKFTELGAGEKRVIKVSFRVKPGTGMGTNIQVKNVLSYEDQIGNRY